MTYETHQSEIKCYRNCRQQHFYRYHEKIEKKKRPRPLLRGTIVHSMIEAHIEGNDPWKEWKKAKKKWSKLFIEEQEEYGDLPDEIRVIMEGFFKFYRKDPIKFIRLKQSKKKTEHHFIVPLTKEINLNFKVDALGRSKDKLRWIIDHKSYRSIPEGEAPYTDLQTMIYTWGLRKLGIKVDGVMWNFIRWKKPTRPGLLSEGDKLSQAKNIDTTWDVYLDTIREHGFKPKDYSKMKDILTNAETKFYKRLYLPINETLLDHLVSEAITTAEEIRDARPPVRSMERHCDWCEYKGLCQAELRGLDAKWIRSNEYQEKDYGKKTKKKKAKSRTRSKRL